MRASSSPRSPAECSASPAGRYSTPCWPAPTDPGALANLARGRLPTKLPALRQALVGRCRGHHAFLVAQVLAHLDYLDETIETVSAQIDTVIAPFADALARLDTIPSVNQRTAEGLIAELGVDMSVFPTAGHLASWAGLCPGNNGVPANTPPAGRAKGIAGCAAPSSRLPSAPARIRRRGPSPPGTAVSCGTVGTRKPSSLSRTPCSSRSTICSPTTPPPTMILVPTTMTAAIPRGAAPRGPRPRTPGLPRHSRTRGLSARTLIKRFSEQSRSQARLGRARRVPSLRLF